ncbi:MAG: substrate-binding domain-containing protein [Bacteroidales bacterium]|nr:substrate-binding domain-containing protein [Bacteroidales bacterium]MDZ4204776.1 substrate-binding domain-containing protein [Bacteroidales bacterium]
MNFDHKKVPEIIQQVPTDKLLLIDWDIHSRPEYSYVRQDFGQPVYDSLVENIDLVRKYERFIYLYPEFTYHPKTSQSYFTKFLDDQQLNGFVMTNYKDFKAIKGDLYLLVSDRTLARFLDQCSEKKLEPGVDIGVISYNETPMKKYVKNGITVLSTDFELLGKKAAEFVRTGQPMKYTVPTRLILRNST